MLLMALPFHGAGMALPRRAEKLAGVEHFSNVDNIGTVSSVDPDSNQLRLKHLYPAGGGVRDALIYLRFLLGQEVPTRAQAIDSRATAQACTALQRTEKLHGRNFAAFPWFGNGGVDGARSPYARRWFPIRRPSIRR
jgi:hypothetical protein